MPSISELLAALPTEQDRTVCSSVSSSSSDLSFQALADRIANRRTPIGIFARTCSVTGLTAKLALAYGAYWIRSWYKTGDRQQQDLLETHLRTALQTLETASYLRGAFAKLGQLAVCAPEGTLPAAWIETMSRLQFQAPPMHWSLIREQLRNEFDDPDAIFAEVDPTPIAAASLGQVHTARLVSGETVAVKIQYPGISRAIRSDLRALKMLFRPFQSHAQWQGLRDLFDELQTGLEAETNYQQEASNLQTAKDVLEHDEQIVVPNVFPNATTRRVLTMEFLQGEMSESFLTKNPSQETRNHYGRLISKASYELYRHHLLYTDSHPGNYIFMKDQRLGVIDFGNLRRLSEREWDFHLAVNQTRKTNDQRAIRQLCQQSLLMSDDDAAQYSAHLDVVVKMFNFLNEPILFEGEFDYGDSTYLQRGGELFSQASKSRWVKQIPANLFAHRMNFQIPAVLLKLKSRVNVPDLMRECGQIR